MITLVSWLWWCRVKLVVGHPRPPSVEALVYRGCPCRDSPVCHRVQGGSVAERQPCAGGWCVSCRLVSACERVCELVLCDGVPHCETCHSPNNCDTCVLWHVGTLTPARRQALPCELIVASNCPTPLFNVTPDVKSRRNLWRVRNLISCLLNKSCSFGMLSAALVPKTDCSSAHVLSLCGGLSSIQPSALFVVELWPCSQQPPSRFVSTAASAFRFHGVLRCNRPGFLAGLELLNCLLYLLLFVWLAPQAIS